MRLSFNWSAAFDDDTRRVHLCKTVKGSAGPMVRKTCMAYSAPCENGLTATFLRRIDPISGGSAPDICARLPPQTTAELMRLCVERWG